MEVEISSVLLYIAIFLIAAKLGGIFAAKLKQPGVFGELIAGILIGPSVAGFLSSQLLGFPIFADSNSPAGQVVGVLSEIGIIILLFLAGLSIDVEEFKRSEKPAALVAASGVAVAFLLGFGTASVFGWTFIEAAFAGGILVATSVGITVRTLIDVNRLHTPVGMTILGAAVIDDVIGIIILTLLSSLALGELSVLGLTGTVTIMGLFFVVLLLVGSRTLPRIVTYVGRIRVEEILLSLTLAIIFLVGGLAEKVNIAAITGAFLVGLILSKSPVAESLRAKASTVGYGLLIPLFFVEMGVRTNIGSLGAVGILALVFVGVAIASKILGCGIGAVMGGYGAMDALRVGIGMMPRAEVALIMAAIGIKAKVVGASLFSMTILVIILTTLITPPLLKLVFKE